MSTQSKQQVRRVTYNDYALGSKLHSSLEEFGLVAVPGEALAEFEERYAALEAENEDLKARLKLIGAFERLRADAREREHVEQTARDAELEALRAAAAGAQGALRQLKRQLDAAADRPLGEVLILAGGVYHYQVRTVLEALAAVLGEGGTAAAEGGGE